MKNSELGGGQEGDTLALVFEVALDFLPHKKVAAKNGRMPELADLLTPKAMKPPQILRRFR